MRVAMTFTGAAACAVAVNPAAMAATGKAEAHAANQLRRAVADGDKRLSGNIRESNCANPNVSHWLHITLHTGYGSSCFGYHGLLDLSPYPNMASFCGGNNSGIIWGQTNGPKSSFLFHDNGTFFYKLPKSYAYFYVTELGISQWHGMAKCPD
jgi:hypothetical protein